MKNKENKNNKIVTGLYFLTALCFYIIAIINFTGKHSDIGVIDLCLGSAFLCLGSFWLNKDKNDKEDES